VEIKYQLPLQLLLLSTFLVIGIIAAYEGARRLACHGIHRKGVFILVSGFGVITCLGLMFCILAYGGHSFLTDFYGADAPLLVKPNLGANLNLEDREKQSLSLAKITYLQTGKILFYIDQSGTTKQFVPTHEDLAQREVWILTRKQLEISTFLSFRIAIFLWLSGLLAGLVGFRVGRKNMP
jgi:hypothetical protein